MKLKDYIQDKRHGKEANQLERDAMNDPFLQDAMDGFDAVSGNHIKDIEKLENEIKTFKNKKIIYYRWWITAAAASIVLILGIGGLMNYNLTSAPPVAIENTKNDTVNTSLLTDRIESKKDTTTVIPVKTIAQNIIRKITVHGTLDKLEKIDKVENDIITSTVENSEVISEMQIDGLKDKISDKEDQKLMFSAASPVQKPISNIIYGKVVDEKNEPVIGASVNVKGTKNRVITDIEGNYKLEIAAESKKDILLSASYIGYNKAEIPVKTDSNIIRMTPDNIAMNEVVVIGYGVKKMSSVTGSIARIESTPDFGEKEFKAFYDKRRNKDLCDSLKVFIKATFTINQYGLVSDINVDKIPCPEMKEEFIKILQQSPQWTNKNRNVRLTIRF